MKALVDDITRRLGAGDAAIFAAQAGLLDDTDLITLTCQLMVEGHGVAWSWHQAVDRMAQQLSALGNPVLAARAADLHDIGRRVLAQIDPGLAASGLHDMPDGQCVLVAADLSPSDTATLRTDRVLGIATALGGPTSHSAILARTLGLPSVVAAGAQLLTLSAGATAMLDGLGDRPLIVRTLDIGGDKQVPHLDLPKEENPFLGVRGARLLLRRPDLLDPQLRALYRAAKVGGDLSIMFPMITSAWELKHLPERCETIRAELDAPTVPVGIMIEVPAATVQAKALAAHADFFSIGTNDLTQYALAIDRQNPELASQADSLHPAVLRLIAMTVEGARAHGRWVGVCGGLAGDPFGAALLAGLDVTELSMTPRDIPAVKAPIRGGRMAELVDLTARALDMEGAAEVRALDGKDR
jgi:phosphoenolpyruvate-protein kinase (PTS system EI component)